MMIKRFCSKPVLHGVTEHRHCILRAMRAKGKSCGWILLQLVVITKHIAERLQDMHGICGFAHLEVHERIIIVKSDPVTSEVMEARLIDLGSAQALVDNDGQRHHDPQPLVSSKFLACHVHP